MEGLRILEPLDITAIGAGLGITTVLMVWLAREGSRAPRVRVSAGTSLRRSLRAVLQGEVQGATRVILSRWTELQAAQARGAQVTERLRLAVEDLDGRATPLSKDEARSFFEEQSFDSWARVDPGAALEAQIGNWLSVVQHQAARTEHLAERVEQFTPEVVALPQETDRELDPTQVRGSLAEPLRETTPRSEDGDSAMGEEPVRGSTAPAEPVPETPSEPNGVEEHQVLDETEESRPQEFEAQLDAHECEPAAFPELLAEPSRETDDHDGPQVTLADPPAALPATRPHHPQGLSILLDTARGESGVDLHEALDVREPSTEGGPSGQDRD